MTEKYNYSDLTLESGKVSHTNEMGPWKKDDDDREITP
jgi:hypothetical protein